MEQKKFNWTKDIPIKAGFYWVRDIDTPLKVSLLLLPSNDKTIYGTEFYGPVSVQMPHDVKCIVGSEYLLSFFIGHTMTCVMKSEAL